MQQFSAHGKLLLTGEYFVLDGAEALALPTQRGQSMQINELANAPDELHWQSFDEQQNAWFEYRFTQAAMPAERSDSPINKDTTSRLMQVFLAIREQSPSAYAQLWGKQIRLQLEFPRNWGLGSSSTLLSLLAQWLEVDAYRLLADSFGGSGYDLACATATEPIIYQRQTEGAPLVQPADWQANYQDQLFFAYQGQKQNSREGIQYYRELCGAQVTLIDEATQLTRAFLEASNYAEAAKVAAAHEDFISTVLQLEKVQDVRFADFPGVVKSLGAWGGDFVLVFSPWPTAATQQYFNEKGCPDVLTYEQMI